MDAAEPRTLILETETPEVVLRELGADDVDAYCRLIDRNRRHLGRHGDFRFELTATREAIEAHLAAPPDDHVRLGVVRHGRLVGRVDLVPINPPHWVIGYWLDETETGRGVATIACRTAVAHARTLGASEVYAGITTGNDASVALVRRLGFDHVQDVEGRSRWRLPLVPDPPPPVMQ